MLPDLRVRQRDYLLEISRALTQELDLERLLAVNGHVRIDLSFAPYYGCITNRPPEVMEFDSPENPIAMDKLLDAAGIQLEGS